MPVEINYPESLNQLIRNYIRLNKIPDRKLQIELRIDKDSPCLTFIIKPYEPAYKVEVFYINHIIKQLANIYARLINQNKFRYRTVFLVVFDKQKELLIDLNINHNLTQTDIDKIDVISPLKQNIHDEEMKKSSWQINSMTVYFYNDSNIIFDFENIDKHCFLQSIFDYVNSGEI